MGRVIFLKYQFKTVLSQQEAACNKKAVGQTNGLVNSGGDKRDRTADLLNAIQALSQLSYTPIKCSVLQQAIYYHIANLFARCFSVFFDFFISKADAV